MRAFDSVQKRVFNYPTFLCALKIEDWLRIDRYCGVPSLDALYQLDRRVRFQDLFAKDPRSIRQRMLSFNFASIHCKPERSRTDAKKRRSFRKVHPVLGPFFLATVNRDTVMAAQAVTRSRVHRLPRPVGRPFRFKIPAMRSSEQIRANMTTASSSAWGVCELFCPRLRRGRCGSVCPAFPVNGEDNLARGDRLRRQSLLRLAS